VKKAEDVFIEILTSGYQLIDSTVDNLPDYRVELDLGCGNGDFSTALGKLYPDRKILAADIMLGRLRKLVKRNKRLHIENVVPLRVEARALIYYMLPDLSVDRIHILCPDPWPKERHKHHRLLCSDFLGQLFRILKNDGVFHFSTDDNHYFDTVCRLVEISGLFTCDNAKLADVSNIKTCFENRWNEMGLKVNHIAWKK